MALISGFGSAVVRVLDVFHHADDLHRRGPSRIGPESEMQADGISPGEVLLGKLLVDHHGRGCPIVGLGTDLDLAVVVDRKIAPGDDRYAERGEITRADLVHEGLRMITGLCGS